MVKSFVGNVFRVFFSFFSSKYPRITNLTSLRNICLPFTRCRFKGASHLFSYFFLCTVPKFNIFFKRHNILNCKNSFFFLLISLPLKLVYVTFIFLNPFFFLTYIYLGSFLQTFQTCRKSNMKFSSKSTLNF